jgi:beta-lactam-binding protein with PASTA domain
MVPTISTRVRLTVGKAPQATGVPDLVGLSYPVAENKLEEAGFLLGGVKEASSNTAPAGVIIKQDHRQGPC